MAVTPKAQNTVFAVMKQVLADANAALTYPLGHAVVVPGVAAVWDCEEIAIRLVGFSPRSTVQGRPPFHAGNCSGVMWVVTLGLSVIRCAATVNDQMQPPSAQQITNDAEAMTQDLEDIRKFLECYSGIKSIIGWRPQGPNGGFHGGEWTFTYEQEMCGCV